MYDVLGGRKTRLYKGIQSSAESKGFYEAPTNWRDWLLTIFGSYIDDNFADHHCDLWDWGYNIQPKIRPNPFVAVWPRGGGKCLLGTSRISLFSGEEVDLVDLNIGDEIVSINQSNWKQEKSTVINKWYSGVKDVYQVRTATNQILTGSQDHPVLTFNGWKDIQDLTVNDRIACVRSLPSCTDEIRLDSEILLLGYMVAEGCTNRKSSFTNHDQIIVQDFKTCCDDLGITYASYRENEWCLTGNGRQWLRSVGLWGHTALTKLLPDWVFFLPVRQKWLLLASLIDTDGYIEHRKLGIALANEHLVKQIQRLFLHVGVLSNIIYKPNEFAGSWALHVDNNCFELCQKNLPLKLKKNRLQRLTAKKRYSLFDIYPGEVVQNLPRGTNRYLRAKGIRLVPQYSITRDKIQRSQQYVNIPLWDKLENADIFWDKIVGIESQGQQATYDIEVSHNSNFVCDKLITHNSSTAEFLAINLGARKVRKYGWYISLTQDLADKHVETIGALLEDENFAKFYPAMSQRAVSKYGQAKGWRRNRLICNNGFVLDALGLLGAERGTKYLDLRPDFMVGDDLDDVLDTEKTTEKKLAVLRKSIYPAGSADCALLMIQNMILENGIFSQLIGNDATFLQTRQRSGPIPAVHDLEYESSWSEEHSRNIYYITGGKPSWEGQNLEICQQQMNDWGLAAFLEESQHEVEEADGGIFDAETFKQCLAKDVPPLSKIVLVIDPAVTSNDNSDCQGIQIDGLDPVTQLIYRLYSWEKQASPVETFEHAFVKALDLGVTKILIETNQGGDTWDSVYREAWANLLKSKAHPQVTKHTRIPPVSHVKATKSMGDKVARANKMRSAYDFGRFIHVEGTHKVLEKALKRFPVKKPFDLVDACYYAGKDLGMLANKKVVVIGI